MDNFLADKIFSQVEGNMEELKTNTNSTESESKEKLGKGKLNVQSQQLAPGSILKKSGSAFGGPEVIRKEVPMLRQDRKKVGPLL